MTDLAFAANMLNNNGKQFQFPWGLTAHNKHDRIQCQAIIHLLTYIYKRGRIYSEGTDRIKGMKVSETGLSSMRLEEKSMELDVQHLTKNFKSGRSSLESNNDNAKKSVQ